MKTGRFVLVYELPDDHETHTIHMQRHLTEWAMKTRAANLIESHGDKVNILLAGFLATEYKPKKPIEQTLNCEA